MAVVADRNGVRRERCRIRAARAGLGECSPGYRMARVGGVP